ncbi:MAG: chemotaxis protein [Hyphomicrobiales bacterium]|nr:MAG: chemotaxis protein [Hyphomicrobiales bacterium]
MLKPHGIERKLDQDDIIVSKTNLKGHITYANDVFLEIADYSLSDVLGQPHSLIRNGVMPRCIFQLLWERLQAGREIFAYVVNNTKNNDAYYWVLAHVTPSRDNKGNITSYHSNRRCPSEAAISTISVLYEKLLDEENRKSNRKDGQKAGYVLLQKILGEKGVDYDEFVQTI